MVIFPAMHENANKFLSRFLAWHLNLQFIHQLVNYLVTKVHLQLEEES